MNSKRFSICIVGGGSTYTPDMMEMLCLVKKEFPLRKIVLYDIDEKRQKPIGEFGSILFQEYYSELDEYIFTCDKDTAFTDIDFALVQIRQGGLELRELDEKIPLKYGVIGQETCGPGGFAYGVRSVLGMIELIHDIRQYSKDAWILNYSNPAAIVAEATKRIFPDDYRILNICDMPISIMDIFAPLAGLKRTDVEPRYFGLNHFGWFTHLYNKVTGKDVLPVLLDKLKNGHCDDELHYTDKNDDYWNFTFKHLEKMVQDYPYSLPNTYLQYYLYPNTMVNHIDPNYTRANEVIDGREKRVKEYCQSIIDLHAIRGTQYDLDKKYAQESHDGIEQATVAHNDAHATYIVELAMSIAYNRKDTFLLMVKNNGIVNNLDDGMMLEVACQVGNHGAEPFHVGEVPTFEKGLLEGQYAYEKLTVDATLEGSYQKALQALVVNRTVVDTDLARKILDDYISVNKDYFPKFK